MERAFCSACALDVREIGSSVRPAFDELSSTQMLQVSI
jgi:hypothetical protein